MTKVQHSSTHPVWNEELRLLVHVPELQSLHVEIRDWDLLNASDHIGRRACQHVSPAGHTCVLPSGYEIALYLPTTQLMFIRETPSLLAVPSIDHGLPVVAVGPMHVAH